MSRVSREPTSTSVRMSACAPCGGLERGERHVLVGSRLIAVAKATGVAAGRTARSRPSALVEVAGAGAGAGVVERDHEAGGGGGGEAGGHDIPRLEVVRQRDGAEIMAERGAEAGRGGEHGGDAGNDGDVEAAPDVGSVLDRLEHGTCHGEHTRIARRDHCDRAALLARGPGPAARGPVPPGCPRHGAAVRRGRARARGRRRSPRGRRPQPARRRRLGSAGRRHPDRGPTTHSRPLIARPCGRGTSTSAKYGTRSPPTSDKGNARPRCPSCRAPTYTARPVMPARAMAVAHLRQVAAELHHHGGVGSGADAPPARPPPWCPAARRARRRHASSAARRASSSRSCR